jgi:hypothetical protein
MLRIRWAREGARYKKFFYCQNLLRVCKMAAQSSEGLPVLYVRSHRHTEAMPPSHRVTAHPSIIPGSPARPYITVRSEIRA